MDNFTSGATPIQPVPAVSPETAIFVSIAQYLLVIGGIIDITNSSKSDQISIFAAFVKLLAIALLILAAFRYYPPGIV
jgi:hypothetical protein